MIVLDRDIVLPSMREDLIISCFGDLHVGDKGCEEHRIRQDFEDCNQNPHNYSVLNGDSIDAIIPKDIKRFRFSSVPQWMLEKSDGFNEDAFIDRQVSRIGSILRVRNRDKILCINDGNHEDAYLKWHGSDISYRIVNDLWGLGVIDDPEKRNKEAAKHLGGYSCYLNLHISFKNNNTKRVITMFLHHGYGGSSRTEGYNLTKYSKIMMSHNAEIFVFSHSHDNVSKVIPWGSPVRSKGGDPKRPRIKAIDRLLLITGTYKKALIEGQRAPSFEEKNLFPLRKLGYVSAKIRFYDNGDVRMGYEVF